MRILKSVVMGMAVFAMIISLSGLALAECSACSAGKHDKAGKEAWAVKIQILRDSAAALQASNPDLSRQLNDLADKKAERLQGWQWSKGNYGQKTKLLEDSASALQESRPDLAQKLRDMSEKKY